MLTWDEPAAWYRAVDADVYGGGGILGTRGKQPQPGDRIHLEIVGYTLKGYWESWSGGSP